MVVSRNGRPPGQFSCEVKCTFISSLPPNRHHLRLIIRWLMLLLMLRISYSSTKPDVEGEALVDLLWALNDSNHQITWNNHLVSPCFSWSHVTCRNGNVISLSLASIGFSGSFSPSITKLKYLASLDLHNNSISGDLPAYLANMAYLQNLNLGDNNFNGCIPTTWGQISSLKHLVLKGNYLSGSIPDSITNLTGLIELDLSDNDLTGRIPEKLLSVLTFNFTGTRLICGSGFEKPCVSSALHADKTKKMKLSVIVTSASCGLFIMFSIGALFAYGYCYMHKLRDDMFVDVSGEDDSKISFGQLKRFSWRELQLATDNYNEANLIGQGGSGKVYKGVLSNNTEVAVKRLIDVTSPGGEVAFVREVQLISVAVHKNLIRLIGFCTTTTERILVYPFMKNLSVAYCLRDLKPGEKGLNWPTRKRVAFGAAYGLVYLHEDCNPKIIHRDVKAANILLDDDFEAVIGDFGLAKLVDTKLTHITTQIRGTMGHIAPEYLSTGKSSEKTDVFGYGITLLELVTGQRAIDLSRLEEEEDVLLLDHIKKLQRENRVNEIVDRNLESYDPGEVETMIRVALICSQNSPEHRPGMREVVSLLGGVNLGERWAEWMNMDHQVAIMTHQFAWTEDSTTHDQEAIQLSLAR